MILMKITISDKNYIAFNILKNRKKILLFFFVFICFFIPLYTSWAWLSCTDELMGLTQCNLCLNGNGVAPWVDCSQYMQYILPLWEWSCSHFQDVYDSCLSNSNQWSAQCEIQPDASWYCLAWYKNVSSCCVLACPGTGYLSGDINSEYTCESCIEGETIPNANHTKCVCDSNFKCCGIKLNTVVPFIWDCIEMNTDSSRSDTTSVTSVTAFPILMQWLMKILMSAIMIFSFLMVIIAWLMMTAWPFSSGSFSKWKTILKNVIISLILLWCSWLILSLINPSFFGG